ncbi:MAG: DegT/DnrJ/EryC1/StrS family aminotransferase [Blastocatellia bacterium]|nr:DegT/DnrJ/EryC1/StrS family aminotransferase [Blastocatellia bacterium]MCS7157478.1 DegT/DnrJ/EryC1/StrS family aminotransferase [Blastocatellia bacterium]MDW8255578.1 DegT/DnrJ/EryC1/StrS family aminotransferase [Acidobacteriota bacterium]
MRIPLVDLRRQHRTIRKRLHSAIKRVLKSGQFVLGEEVARFEREWAAYCGVPHAVGTASGAAALHLAMLVLGIGPGDEVITVPFTFIATASEITRTGARPVFVDIDPRSYTLDVAKLIEKLEREYYFDERIGHLVNRATLRRLKAIVPVHLYGQMADMRPILELARRYNFRVVEDAAQAHGAEYRGEADSSSVKAGSLGDIGCFSFYPSKNLGACGEAGALVTRNGEWAQRLRRLVNNGRGDGHWHLEEGFNYRLDALQAAILHAKLRYLDRWNERRRELAALYRQKLSDVEEIALPEEMPYARHVYHLFVIRVPDRDRVRQALNEQGIGAAVHYPVPLHLQPAYRHLGYEPGDFPVAEMCARTVLSLPLYPELREKDIARVVRALRQALRARR